MTTIEIMHPTAEIETPRAWIRSYPQLLERWARTCYKSEDKITPSSAEGFLRKLLSHTPPHESVIEHLSITARIICSRGCSHELVRHRLGSFSQESTRYCNYGKAGRLRLIIPHPLREHIPRGAWQVTSMHSLRYGRPEASREDLTLLQTPTGDLEVWVRRMLGTYETYLNALASGQRPQIARGLLPIDIKTEVVTTFNLRQWRHVLRLRALNKRAHPEIRSIMLGLLEQLEKLLPCVFDGLRGES